MGTLLIKKYQNNNENMPKAYKKWYGRLIHRGTLGTSELAEHIMKHGTVYTDDVVMGVTRKLMHCIAEQLADGYKVKLSTDLKPYGYAETDDEDDGDDNGGGGAIEENP